MLVRRCLALFLLVLSACKGDAPPPPTPSKPAANPAASAPQTTPAASAKATKRPAKLSRAMLAQRARQATPFLWSIGRGKETLGHVFGTVHLGVDAKTELNRVVWDTFGACRTFIMEADPSTLQPAELRKYALLPEKQSLRGQLPATSMKRLVATLGPTMMGVRLEQLRPWILSAALTRKFTPINGKAMDVAFHEAASRETKKMAFLETSMQQLQLLSKAIDAKSLQNMLENLRRSRNTVQVALRAYRAGNFEQLRKAIFAPNEVKKNPEMYRQLFDQRNKAWLPIIERSLQSKGVFIAVGTGHLMGPTGLSTTLRKRGYTLRRVQAAAPAQSAQDPTQP